MSESIKAVCSLVLIVAVITAFVVWFDDRPSATVWTLRIGGPILAAASLAVILGLHFRRDQAPDYLRQLLGTYFNRDGFCFGLVVRRVDGIACFDAYFQNQFERPCVGRIALRPAQGFWLTRANVVAMTFEIECGPGAFGFTRLPVPIAEKHQGKRMSFEVGANVDYPKGKGRRLRFHDGLFIRSNTSFGSGFGTALTVAGAATGSLVLSKPATTSVELPKGVAQELPAGMKPQTVTLWKLGDPPLKMEG